MNTNINRNIILRAFLFIAVLGILLPMVSAWDITLNNVRDYNSTTKTVSVYDTYLLWENKIADVKLKSDLNVNVLAGKDRLVANITIVNYVKDYQDFMRGIDLYDVENKMKRVDDRRFTFRLEQVKEVEVDNYIDNCNIKIEGTNICTKQIKGTKIVNESTWVNFDEKSPLPIGTINIGLFTDVEYGEVIDWIPNIFGVRINEWATWTGSAWNLTTCTDLQNIDLNKSGIYQLGQDINCSGVTSWTTIGIHPNYFTGQLKGNNHTIYGLEDLTMPEMSGIFGWVVSTHTTSADPAISNLRLENITFKCASDNCGVLIGSIRGGYVTQISAYNVEVNTTGAGAGMIAQTYGGASVLSDIRVTNSRFKGNRMVGTFGYVTGANVYVNKSYSAENRIEGSACGDREGCGALVGGLTDGAQALDSWDSNSYVIGTAAYTGGVIGHINNDYAPGAIARNISWYNNTADAIGLCYNGVTSYCTQISDINSYKDTDATSTTPMDDKWDFVNIWKTKDADYPVFMWEEAFPGAITITPTLVAPAGYTNTSSNTNYFNSTAKVADGNITNATLHIWDGSTFTNVTTFSSGEGVSVGANLTYYLSDGTYNWSYEYCGVNSTSSACAWGANRTLTIDSSAPSITINFPTNKYIGTNLSLHQLTYTISDALLDACWVKNLTNDNTTIPCAGVSNFTFPNFGIDYNLTIYANDSLGHSGQASVAITAVNTTGTQTAPATSLESLQQNFTIYVNRSTNVSITPTFVYNGTSYTSGITASGYNYSINITIPILSGTTTPQTNNYYWTFNMSFLSGTSQTSMSDIKTISVSQVLFGPCSASLILQVLNITFKDEVTGDYINATMDASTWNYAIEGTTKSFTFSNATLNAEYDFCIAPSYVTSVISGAELQYSSTNGVTYPQRKYIYNTTFYNTTLTNKTLYLLDFNHGTSSTFQVITMGNQVVAGAYLKMERMIGGVLTVVAEGYTDDAGTITFFLNPNYEHTLTVSKTGYATQVQHIFPTLPSYTITLGTSGGFFNYTSPIAGLRYTKFPPSGIIQNGMYNFTFEVYARENIVYNCSFYIRYLNGTTKASAFGCNESAPNQGGKISTMVNVTRIDRLYGAYYIGTSNGTIMIEGDARWVNVNITGDGTGYYSSLIYALRDIVSLPEWGGQCPDSYTLNETDMYCYNAAGEKKWNQTGDFSRMVFFFIFFAIILAALNFFTGYDTAYPGAFIYLMTGIVFILSSINGVAGPGFFYLYGATNSSFFGSLSSIVNNWIVFVHFLMLTLIYFFTTNKRYQAG
jgi:hypothetical protein